MIQTLLKPDRFCNQILDVSTIAIIILPFNRDHHNLNTCHLAPLLIYTDNRQTQQCFKFQRDEHLFQAQL